MARIYCLLVAAVLALTTCPVAAQSSSGSFQNAGLTLHYSVAGTGPPVVILSGGPGFDAQYMAPVAQMLAPTHTVILLDQRGTGRSIPTSIDATTVNEDLVVADVEALRRKLGLPRISLVGHSFGTFTAMRYAIAHPDNVERVVLLGTVPPRSVDDTSQATIFGRVPPAGQARLAEIDAAWPKASPEERDALGREAATITLPSALYDRSKAPMILAQMAAVKTHGQTTELLNRAINNYDLTDGLRTVHSAVLIIQGRQDFLDVKIAEKTRDAIPGAKLVVLERCGHFAWIEAPDTLRKAMVAFLPGSDDFDH